MRQNFIIGLAAAAALSACGPTDHRAVSGPQFDHVQDLDGTPDLIVDGQRLADSWVVYDQTFSTTACSVVEGGVAPGEHRVLRFTVTTPNIGDADIFIGDPNVHVAANDGLFEFATCHNHYHFRHYATYQLISASDGHIWRSAKRGFCMIDVTPWQSDGGVGSWVYRSCGRVGIPGNQGISVDRKSTRLNSSHRTISYAVFCLKKKKYIKISFCRVIRMTSSMSFTRAANRRLTQGATWLRPLATESPLRVQASAGSASSSVRTV